MKFPYFRKYSISLILNLLLFSIVNPDLTVADEFSSPITWMTRDGMYAAPVHVAHLPSGELLLVGRTRDTFEPQNKTRGGDAVFTMTPSLNTPNILYVDNIEPTIPFEYRLQPVTPPWAGGSLFAGNDTLYCAGQTLTADGKVIFLGGTRSYYNSTEVHHVGLPYSLTYDGTSWERVPGYFQGLGFLGSVYSKLFPQEVLTWRWYSTGTRLADDRILITGGFDYVLGDLSDLLRSLTGMPGTPNVSVEIYDPATKTYDLLVDVDTAPMLLWNRDYTHTFQLPVEINGQYDVMMFGEFGAPVLFSTKTPAHFEQPGMAGVRPIRPNSTIASRPNNGASTVLLPLRVNNGEWGYNNGSVLMAAGEDGIPQGHLADIYDPVANKWLPSIDLIRNRHHASTILLPDGKVMIIEGHDGANPNLAMTVQYIDPANGMALTSGTATHSEIRGYHSITALLIDGRILLGGGNPVGGTDNERVDFRYYSPDYISQPRPSIVSVSPGPFAYGQYYALVSDGSLPVAEIVLISPAAMTHSFDQNQRYIQLKKIYSAPVPNTSQVVNIFQTPPNSKYAPRGDYMLFAVDENRVPSVAKMIKLQ